MKALILAAGYAKRLYPLTLNQPKPLLPVGGKPILSHIAEKIVKIKLVDQIYVVTNDRFFSHFQDWKRSYSQPTPCEIFNDGTTDNENRLGAIGDIRFVLEKTAVRDDFLILAGDNIFEFELGDFVRFFKAKGSSIACFDLGSFEKASQYGVLKLGAGDRILEFLEKPRHSPSSLISTGVYAYTSGDLDLLNRYLSEKGPADAPGYFLSWLIKEKDVYGFRITGGWYDIGDMESYKEADLRFRSK